MLELGQALVPAKEYNKKANGVGFKEKCVNSGFGWMSILDQHTVM